MPVPKVPTPPPLPGGEPEVKITTVPPEAATTAEAAPPPKKRASRKAKAVAPVVKGQKRFLSVGRQRYHPYQEARIPVVGKGTLLDVDSWVRVQAQAGLLIEQGD